MKVSELRQKMEDLRTLIQDADSKIRGGTMVNLSGLEANISTICTKATALKAQDAMDIQPLMAELIGELERLTISLQDFRDNIK